MPATLVHPAAVLPFFHLARRHLPLSALVVGSLAPDFEYLWRWGAGNRFAHTLRGLEFCIPAGLLVLWIFHSFVKGPMLELLPEWHRERLRPHAGPFRWLSWARLPLILLAVTLGALSHMAWDSFTHSGAWGVQAFPELNRIVYSSGPMKLRIYSLLQHGSTPVGLAVLVAWYWLWARRAPAPQEAAPSPVSPWLRRLLWAALVLGSLVLGLTVGLIVRGRNHGEYGLKLLVGGLGMGSHAGLYAMVLAYGVGFTLWRWQAGTGRDRIPAGGEKQGP